MNQQTINKIRELSKSKTFIEIGKELKLSPSLVRYWSSEETRKQRIKESRNLFNKKSKEEKRKIYASRKDYIRNYMRNRYQSDEIFREKIKKKSREYLQNKQKEKK